MLRLSLPHQLAARVIVEARDEKYNEDRQRRSLGGLLPPVIGKTLIQKLVNVTVAPNQNSSDAEAAGRSYLKTLASNQRLSSFETSSATIDDPLKDR